jgi:hypothetical protein
MSSTGALNPKELERLNILTETLRKNTALFSEITSEDKLLISKYLMFVRPSVKEKKPDFQERPRKSPRMLIDKWKRFPEKLDFSDTFRSVIAGSRTGTGKSALLETIVDKHDKYNFHCGKVIDIFASRDNENLAWLRHDRFKNGALLLHGDSAHVSCEWDQKKISEVTLKDFQEHKTIISAPSFYGEIKEEWYAISKITNLLWKRKVNKREPWCIAVREGTSLLYSRLGLGDNQSQAKAMFTYACREFRHSGCALVIDILRLMGLDIEVRALADQIFLKAHGIEALPQSLNFIYKHYDMFVDIMKMPEWCFIVLTKNGGIGNGRFNLPYWHKEKYEDLFTSLNINIEYGDKINYGERNRDVSDFEHANIMMVRTTGVAISKIANGGKFDVDGTKIELRARSSATATKHIHKHNDDIKALGYCDTCKRVDSTKTFKRIL